MKISVDNLAPVDIANKENNVDSLKIKKFINNDWKVVKSVIEPNTSTGKHIQIKNEYIYVVEGQAKIITGNEEEIVNKDEIHFCKLGTTQEIFNNKNEDLIILNVTVE